MFAVILKYKKPMEDVELFTPAHRAYLDKQYQAGLFLLSGRQTPPQGGVIIAKAENRDTLLALLQQDPFYTEGIADYEVYEFEPTKFQPFLQPWLSQKG